MLVGHRLDVPLDLSLEKFDSRFREWVHLKRVLGPLAGFSLNGPDIPASTPDN
jgi:hypothetical protein